MVVFKSSKEIEQVKLERDTLAASYKIMQAELEAFKQKQLAYKALVLKCKNEIDRLNGLNDSLGKEIVQKDRTVEGLKEAVGRWRKKVQGDKISKFNESFDGMKHSYSLTLDFPPDTKHEDVWEILKRQYELPKAYNLKRISRRGDNAWTATYEK